MLIRFPKLDKVERFFYDNSGIFPSAKENLGSELSPKVEDDACNEDILISLAELKKPA